MNKRETAKQRKSRNQVLHRIELDQMLDVLSAFDRGVVEFSMGLYNLPRRERVIMRRQNRRLHRALRARLLKPPRALVELSGSR